MSYWSWDLVFQDRSNIVRGDFLLWKHLFFRITFSALVLIQDHKTNFFQTLTGCCYALDPLPTPKSQLEAKYTTQFSFSLKIKTTIEIILQVRCQLVLSCMLMIAFIYEFSFQILSLMGKTINNGLFFVLWLILSFQLEFFKQL